MPSQIKMMFQGKFGATRIEYAQTSQQAKDIQKRLFSSEGWVLKSSVPANSQFEKGFQRKIAESQTSSFVERGKPKKEEKMQVQMQSGAIAQIPSKPMINIVPSTLTSSLSDYQTTKGTQAITSTPIPKTEFQKVQAGLQAKEFKEKQKAVFPFTSKFEEKIVHPIEKFFEPKKASSTISSTMIKEKVSKTPSGVVRGIGALPMMVADVPFTVYETAKGLKGLSKEFGIKETSKEFGLGLIETGKQIPVSFIESPFERAGEFTGMYLGGALLGKGIKKLTQPKVTQSIELDVSKFKETKTGRVDVGVGRIVTEETRFLRKPKTTITGIEFGSVSEKAVVGTEGFELPVTRTGIVAKTNNLYGVSYSITPEGTVEGLKGTVQQTLVFDAKGKIVSVAEPKILSKTTGDITQYIGTSKEFGFKGVSKEIKPPDLKIDFTAGGSGKATKPFSSSPSPQIASALESFKKPILKGISVKPSSAKILPSIPKSIYAPKGKEWKPEKLSPSYLVNLGAEPTTRLKVKSEPTFDIGLKSVTKAPTVMIPSTKQKSITLQRQNISPTVGLESVFNLKQKQVPKFDTGLKQVQVTGQIQKLSLKQKQVARTSQKYKIGQVQKMSFKQMQRISFKPPSIPNIPSPKIPSMPFSHPSRISLSQPSRRKKVSRRKKSMLDMGIIPSADWLSLTMTEAKKRGKGHHPYPSPKIQKMFRKNIFASSLRFPTAEMLRGKGRLKL